MKHGEQLEILIKKAGTSERLFLIAFMHESVNARFNRKLPPSYVVLRPPRSTDSVLSRICNTADIEGGRTR